MSQEILVTNENGSLSFGNHLLAEKTKVEDYPYEGDLLKVKTYKTLTKLEKNGMLIYESEPGTTVKNFVETPNGVSFEVAGDEDAMLTIGLEDETEYKVLVDGVNVGKLKTNLSGKLSVSVELSGKDSVEVKINK